MIDTLIYIGFFWMLVFQAVLFVSLNLPTPKNFKHKILKVLSTSKLIEYLMYAHLVSCLIAVFFYIDLSQQEGFHLHEKQTLRTDASRHVGTELRLGFLSYTILKIQRNKYITFMLVYTSIALNLFIQLLKFMYKKRQHLESLGLIDVPVRKNSQKPQPHTVQTSRDSINRDSTNRDSTKKSN